jgi:hypothetical protein
MLIAIAILLFSGVCAGMAIVGFRDLKSVEASKEEGHRAATV